MAALIFGPQLVNGQTMRVVDFGSGQIPRLTVETQLPADSLGGHGWAPMTVIDIPTFAALLLAAHVIT